MPGSAVREATMKLLYEAEMSGPDNEDTLDALIGFTPDQEDLRYIEAVLVAVRDNAYALDSEIERYAVGWTIDRIAKVDLCILRLALTEIILLRDARIPTAVSIDEAVNLTKTFSTPEAGAFVNGILGSIVRARGE